MTWHDMTYKYLQQWRFRPLPRGLCHFVDYQWISVFLRSFLPPSLSQILPRRVAACLRGCALSQQLKTFCYLKFTGNYFNLSHGVWVTKRAGECLLILKAHTSHFLAESGFCCGTARCLTETHSLISSRFLDRSKLALPVRDLCNSDSWYRYAVSRSLPNHCAL